MNLLLQQLVDGQKALEGRMTNIETLLAEKRGERRALGLFFHGVSGAIGSIITLLVQMRKH